MQQLIAFIFLLMLIPVLGLAMLLVLFIDWQTPWFVQERIGKNHVPFRIYKLRTMKYDKITLLGKILRSTGLDLYRK